MSDPGSKSSQHTWNHVDLERAYGEALSEHLNQPREEWNKSSQFSEAGDTATTQDDLSMIDGTSISDSGNRSDAHMDLNLTDLRSSSRALDDDLQVQGHARSGMSGRKSKKRQLQAQIKNRAQGLSEVTWMVGLSTALSAIEEIPEQVGDELQRHATNLVDEVQTDLTAMRAMIRDEDPCDPPNRPQLKQREDAVENLEAIPEIILNKFEAKIEKAKEDVRRRVNNVKRDLTTDLSSEQIVQGIRAIPREIQQITNLAVEEAVAESRVQAQQQFDKSLQSLPDLHLHADALMRKTKLSVARVPQIYQQTLKAVEVAALSTVEQAVATVKETKETDKIVANQAVAESLLRAKFGNKLGPAELEPADPPPMNPGSVGHPELCPRPCLYFVAGSCVNGNMCDFCHLPHTKRPAHLDKRHRKMLKDMPFDECLALLLPIITMKVTALGLATDEDMASLRHVIPMEGDPRASDDASSVSSSKKTSRNARLLPVALKAMSLRSLLTTLHRAASQEPAYKQREIEDLLQTLRNHRNISAFMGALDPASSCE